MLLDGLLLGGALAAVTRTRRPLLIYLWLGVAALSLWWLIVFQLPGEAESVQLWQGAPSLLKNYFDILRVGVFLAGIPYPFIRIGHHAPDIPSNQ